MFDSQSAKTEGRPRNDDRIVLIGTTGVGKTTMAKRIAQALDMDHIEFDAIRHGPNWTETPDDLFRERLRQLLQGNRWVGDGNYSFARDVVWPRATMLVWLDYPIWVVQRRLFWRTIRRGVLREELWHGNRERLWWHFSAIGRYSYGQCGLIGAAGGRYRQRWLIRTMFIWTWSACARRRLLVRGSWP